MFSRLELVISDSNLNLNNSMNLTLNSIDSTRSNGTLFNFSVTIQSQEELLYAQNMLSIYKNIIRPFFKSEFNEMTKYFDRVFFSTDRVSYSLGKTVHDTRYDWDFTTHLMERFYDYNTTDGASLFAIHQSQKGYMYAPTNVAYLSHFRKHQNFLDTQIPFKRIFLDLNYFLCYIVPIVREEKSAIA